MGFLHMDLKTLIQIIGYLGIFIFVFAESGLFFGFFLPGDSLLFTAGLLASEGYFSLSLIILIAFVAAVAGDSVGYSFGKRMGPLLFNREESHFFKKSYVKKSSLFYDKHGSKTIIFARFIPIVRTFAPILAGTAQMDYRKFLAFNIVGGLLWTVSLPVLGFLLGQVIPDIDRYILPATLAVVAISFLPVIWQLIKKRTVAKV
ncbi:MAG: VTT domain-containing protein [Candidatus Pacebacteria bacterium]|nr:VTT domain-containing protein [Candidatus Paceibacterota bacterium]